MHYKTIVLELLQQRPQYHEELRQNRTMLATLERLARSLKESHLSYQATLAHSRPGSDPIQLASEALELALQDLVDSLPTEDETGLPHPMSGD